ncbi:MAG: iron ABC transporter permease [candidate division KSB1 bacterium]|nr:iron ABC transporter permease [candidate division KSB1 bacterium]MDZ7341702.1 iron ABC transporter permease [candidate division KSB1 bacterium]
MVVLTRKIFVVRLMLFLLLLVAAIGLAPLIGSTTLDFSEVFAWPIRLADNRHAQIFFSLRLPRVLMAGLTGATLAVAGLVFQALLRNPLADPFTLGVASGAALGAVLALKLGWAFQVLGFSAISLLALGGALLSILINLLFVSLGKPRFSTYAMILAGVSISFFFSSLILLVHYLADFTETQQMVRWIMGGLDIVNYSVIVRLLPFCLIGFLVLIYFSRHLNLISMGEDAAMARGIQINRVKLVIFCVASVLTGLVVAHSGPIGFVGLMVPHILRLLIGADHRLLLPASLLFGATFLIGCDTIARIIIAPAEIPVGIVTALCGGPFFVGLILRRKTLFS